MTEETQASSSPQRDVDVKKELSAMPFAEKLLAGAAVAMLLAVLIEPMMRRRIFNHGFWATCALIGAAVTIALVALHVLGIKVMDAKTRTYAVVGAAVLPILGFLIDLLEGQRLWGIIALVAMFVMAFAGLKITNRENLIKKSG